MRSWRKYQDTSYMLKLPLESGHWPSSGLRLCLITFPRPVWISHIPHSLYFPFSSECPQCRSICFVFWRWTFFISLFFFIRFSSPANGYRVPPVSLFCLLTFFQFNFPFFHQIFLTCQWVQSAPSLSSLQTPQHLQVLGTTSKQSFLESFHL